MPNTAADLSAPSVQELLQLDSALDWTLLTHCRSTAKPIVPVGGNQLATAIENGDEQENASEDRSPQRWHALDRLLRISFGLISPAYLFDSFL